MVPGPHGRGALVPHPRPPDGGRRPRGRRRAGAPRPERRGRGPPVLRPRGARREPQRSPAGVVGRHQWRRGLHDAVPRPRHRTRRRRRAGAHVLRHRLVDGRGAPLLRGTRRGHAALPGVAPPAGHAAGRGRAGAPGGRRAVLPGRRAEPQRAGRAADQREQDLGRDLLHPGGRARGRAGARRAPGSRPRVQRRPPGRPLRHPHQPRRRGLPRRDRADGRARAEPPGPTSRRTCPAAGSPASTPSTASWCSTSGTTPCPDCACCSTTAASTCPPSRRRCTRSTSATTPSTDPTPCAWSTSPS